MRWGIAGQSRIRTASSEAMVAIGDSKYNTRKKEKPDALDYCTDMVAPRWNGVEARSFGACAQVGKLLGVNRARPFW